MIDTHIEILREELGNEFTVGIAHQEDHEMIAVLVNGKDIVGLIEPTNEEINKFIKHVKKWTNQKD